MVQEFQGGSRSLDTGASSRGDIQGISSHSALRHYLYIVRGAIQSATYFSTQIPDSV